MGNALSRMQRQQRMAKGKGTPKEDTPSPAEAAAEEADDAMGANVVPPARTKKGTEIPDTTAENGKRVGISIRGICMTMLKQNKSTKEIADVIKEKFPNSAAAKKPSKHIAFYRSKLKKESGNDAG